jgi:hypothetical protein
LLQGAPLAFVVVAGDELRECVLGLGFAGDFLAVDRGYLAEFMDLAADYGEGIFGDDFVLLPGGDGVLGSIAHADFEARGRGHDALVQGFAADELGRDFLKRLGFAGQTFGELLGALVGPQNEGEAKQQKTSHVSSFSYSRIA